MQTSFSELILSQCRKYPFLGKDWEHGISRYKLLHIGWINNKVLQSIQQPVINRNGKEHEKVFRHLTVSLDCTGEIDIHCKSTILQLNTCIYI